MIMHEPNSVRTVHYTIQLAGLGVFAIILVISCIYSYRFMMSNQLFEEAALTTSLDEKVGYVHKSAGLNPYDVEKWNTLALLLNEKSGQRRLFIHHSNNE